MVNIFARQVEKETNVGSGSLAGNEPVTSCLPNKCMKSCTMLCWVDQMRINNVCPWVPACMFTHPSKIIKFICLMQNYSLKMFKIYLCKPVVYLFIYFFKKTNIQIKLQYIQCHMQSVSWLSHHAVFEIESTNDN